MNNKFQAQSPEEREEFLLIAGFLILIAAIFLITSFLLNRYFPEMRFSTELLGYRYLPAMSLFQSLALISVLLALFICGTTFIKWFYRLQIPLALVCLAIGAIAFASFIIPFSSGNYAFGIRLLGTFTVESAMIGFTSIKFIDWLDSRYGNDHQSLLKEFLGKAS